MLRVFSIYAFACSFVSMPFLFMSVDSALNTNADSIDVNKKGIETKEHANA